MFSDFFSNLCLFILKYCMISPLQTAKNPSNAHNFSHEAQSKDIVSHIHTPSFCIQCSLIHFKIVHRLHYSNDELAKLYPNVAPKCPRCQFSAVSLGHMFWSSQYLSNSWTTLMSCLLRHSYFCIFVMENLEIKLLKNKTKQKIGKRTLPCINLVMLVVGLK